MNYLPFLQFVREFFDRIQSESPVFFKRLQWVFGVLSFILILAKSAIDFHLWHPEHSDGISELLGHIIVGTTTIFGMSHLPVKDGAGSAGALKNSRTMDAGGPGGIDPTDPHGEKRPS